MNKAEPAITGFTPLTIPVPPMLAKATGYTGGARFVSFQWTPYGDETDYSDGRVSATGNWQAYLTYIRHPTVSPLLKGYDLGSSDSEAKHALILDQEKQALYVAPVRQAKKFLAEQWPKEPPVQMSKEEYNAFVMKAMKNLTYARSVSMDEVKRRIAEQHAIVEELQQWLDKQLKN